MSDKIQLLLNQGIVTGAAVLIERPGTYVWTVTGTFGGATAYLEYLGPTGVTWVNPTGISMTVAVDHICVIEEDTYVRCRIASGSPSGLSSYLERIY